MVTAEQISLHSCWLRADTLKYALYPGEMPNEKLQDWPEWLKELAIFHSKWSRIEIMYALLYVVIEGYTEMGYKDERLDSLLAEGEYVDCLRKFRNAIFHFQKQPINEKLLGFIEAKDSEFWVRAVHNEFNRFFLETLPIKQQMDTLINNCT